MALKFDCPIAYWSARTPDALAIDGLTYRALDALVTGCMSQIKEKRIAFIAHRTPLTLALFFACFRMQAIACPLSPRLPQDAVQEALQKLGTPLFTPAFQMHAGEWKQQLDGASDATLLFTSSKAKIALHTLANHFISAHHAIRLLQLDQSSRTLLSLPLNHVGGLAACIRSLIAGGTLIEDEESATHISYVPTQLYRLNKALPHLKCLLIGGAALREKVPGLPLHISYGMTETSSFIAFDSRPIPETEIKIVDGEIWVRGPTVFKGYLDQESPFVDGWFPTRDMGAYEEGKLEWKGRKDRRFKAGGETIQPEEIEEEILRIPGILHAHITPMSDPEFGFLPKAQIYGKEIPLEELQAILRRRLPGYKIPRTVEFIDDPSFFLSKAKD